MSTDDSVQMYDDKSPESELSSEEEASLPSVVVWVQVFKGNKAYSCPKCLVLDPNIKFVDFKRKIHVIVSNKLRSRVLDIDEPIYGYIWYKKTPASNKKLPKACDLVDEDDYVAMRERIRASASRKNGLIDMNLHIEARVNGEDEAVLSDNSENPVRKVWSKNLWLKADCDDKTA